MERSQTDRQIGQQREGSDRTEQANQCDDCDHETGRAVDAEAPSRKAVRADHQEGPGLAQEGDGRAQG